MHNPNTINMSAFLAAFMTGGYTIAEFEATLIAAGYNTALITTVINTLRAGGTTIRGAYYISRVVLLNPYYVAAAGMAAGTIVGLYGVYNYFQQKQQRSQEYLIAAQVQRGNLNRQLVVLRQNTNELQAAADSLQPEVDELEQLQTNLQQVRQFEQYRLRQNQELRNDLRAQGANMTNNAANARTPHL